MKVRRKIYIKTTNLMQSKELVLGDENLARLTSRF